jgi:hypothetical protein
LVIAGFAKNDINSARRSMKLGNSHRKYQLGVAFVRVLMRHVCLGYGGTTSRNKQLRFADRNS